MARRALLVSAVLGSALMVTAGLPVLAATAFVGADDGSTAIGMPARDPAMGKPAIPAAWSTLEEQAASTCPGLPWSVLGAIGTVESDSGQSSAPGVWSGANAAGAEGPMQFEPATFATYATVGPGGLRPPSRYDSTDAVYTAAAMLCADGASSPGTLRQAVLDYNHSSAYADVVLTLTMAFATEPTLSVAGEAAIAFAARQLGVPYAWGGTGPDGFDCSGLVQAAYASAGVPLPRVAEDQFDAGPTVPSGSPLEPGDLVFFGSGPAGVSHVGLVVGPGIMIDAPDTGAVVRAEAFPVAVGAPWGDNEVVGATRPDG